MRNFWLFPVVTVFSLALAGGAMADGSSKYYVDVGGGYTIIDDADLSDSTLPGVSGTLSADGGYQFTAAIGREMGSGFRAELEFSYRQADLDDITIAAFGLTATGVVDGDVSTLSGMANVLYDFELDGKITPYIGGGLGVASINVEIDSVAGVTTAFDDSDTVIAYQGLVGLRYPLTDQISIRGGYRLFATGDPEFGTTEGEFLSHNIEVGLSYNF
jgi:opacity protein-like surface antigen